MKINILLTLSMGMMVVVRCSIFLDMEQIVSKISLSGEDDRAVASIWDVEKLHIREFGLDVVPRIGWNGFVPAAHNNMHSFL